MTLTPPTKRPLVSRGWFRISNVILDHYGAVLGPVGIAVYTAIARRTGSNTAAFPSYRDIARLAGIDRSTAMRTMKRLVSLGLVTVRHRADAGGQHSNLYFLTPVDEVVAQIHRENEEHSGGIRLGGDTGAPVVVAQSCRGSGEEAPKEHSLKQKATRRRGGA